MCSLESDRMTKDLLLPLWMKFPLEDCSVFGNFVITLIPKENKTDLNDCP